MVRAVVEEDLCTPGRAGHRQISHIRPLARLSRPPAAAPARTVHVLFQEVRGDGGQVGRRPRLSPHLPHLPQPLQRRFTVTTRLAAGGLGMEGGAVREAKRGGEEGI